MPDVDSSRHPVARSPIRPAAPVTQRHGWEVSARRSTAALRLADHTPMSKVLVHAAPDSEAARRLGVPIGRAGRDEHGTLVVGSGPGEWLLIGPVGTAGALGARVAPSAEPLVTVVELTHGRALMRMSGEPAAETLAKLCAVDLHDSVTPNGSAFRSPVAAVTTDVVRDDVDGVVSYLLHCERSSGQYLADALLDAGAEFGIDEDGFPPERTDDGST